MNSFGRPGLEPLHLTHGLLQTVRALGEARGRQELFARQSPQALETLKQTATIQSTESSNRIEGVTAPPKRIQALISTASAPRNRSEQEILGYRDVLATIHASAEGIPFTVGVVRQLHRDLFQYAPLPGGIWKTADNDITETLPDGTHRVRFRPTPAHLVEPALEALHGRFRERWEAEEIDRLLLIPAYVLDFLCVHPFRDGNGRMARLLTLLLLYQAGYEVGRFISLERIIETTKEDYYASLYASSQGWHEGAHPLLPWTEYFLGVLLAAYREFEARAGTLVEGRGAKTQIVRAAIERLTDGFRMVDVERLCPTVSRDMIRRVLRSLRSEGIVSEGSGASAVWRKPRS